MLLPVSVTVPPQFIHRLLNIIDPPLKIFVAPLESVIFVVPASVKVRLVVVKKFQTLAARNNDQVPVPLVIVRVLLLFDERKMVMFWLLSENAPLVTPKETATSLFGLTHLQA